MNPIQQLYDYYSRREAEKRAHKAPPIRFRPSEIGGCQQEIYYRLAGNEPKPFTPDTLRMFDDGDLHHDQVRRDMEKAGVELTDLTITEAAVTETGGAKRVFPVEFGGKTYEVEISGRNDGGVVYDGISPVLEIKSVNKYKFTKYHNIWTKGGNKALLALLKDEAKPKAGARPEPAHANRRVWYQFQATLLLLGRPNMFVVFKEKDMGQIGFKDADGKRDGLLIEADPEVQAMILQRCAMILRALEKGVPPSTEFADGSTTCGMCAFRHLCWGALKQEG
jgi:hypothetical protein